jgi:hypothetical protein
MDATDFMDKNTILLQPTREISAPTNNVIPNNINRVAKCTRILGLIITMIGVIIILTYGTVKDLLLYLDDGVISSHEILDYIIRVNPNITL